MATAWYYVTGCDSGFGKEAVCMLKERGLHVFAGCYTTPGLEAIEADGQVIGLLLDVTKDESVNAAAEKIQEHLERSNGFLAGLVNNAGLLKDIGPVEWTPISNWQAMWEVNVLGTVRVTNSVLPLLRLSRGRIVNVASVAGRVAFVNAGAYSATKYAVEGYSDALRREMLPWGVTVHIIEPGIYPQTGLYETFSSGLKKLWSALPPKLQEDYGNAYIDSMTSRYTKGTLTKIGNKDPREVPFTYCLALLDERPMYRYRVGFDSRFSFGFLSMIHESWQDNILTENQPFPGETTPADKKATVARYVPWTLARRLCFALLVLVSWKVLKRWL